MTCTLKVMLNIVFLMFLTSIAYADQPKVDAQKAQELAVSWKNYLKLSGLSGLTPQKEIIIMNIYKLRVEQEKIAVKKTGHKMALPVGRCEASIQVGADGVIQHVDFNRCDSLDVRATMLQAINMSSPLPLLPSQTSAGGVFAMSVAPLPFPPDHR